MRDSTLSTHAFVYALVVIKIPSLTVAFSFLLNSLDATLQHNRWEDCQVTVLEYESVVAIIRSFSSTIKLQPEHLIASERSSAFLFTILCHLRVCADGIFFFFSLMKVFVGLQWDNPSMKNSDQHIYAVDVELTMFRNDVPYYVDFTDNLWTLAILIANSAGYDSAILSWSNNTGMKSDLGPMAVGGVKLYWYRWCCTSLYIYEEYSGTYLSFWEFHVIKIFNLHHISISKIFHCFMRINF